MRFFRSPQDLSEWVKTLGAKKAATILVNLPRVGKSNAYDIMETTNRIVSANDNNATEVLFSLLKTAGIAENLDKSIEKIDNDLDQVKAANELLDNKVISASEHSKMVKQATYLRDPAVYDMPLRVCPKLPPSMAHQLISTYNCRHYCLDAIVLDDDPLRVYCGEILWRRHVADKFSSDQQERKTGELYGGYVNERFYKFHDAGTPANPDVPRNGGNPMSLKPGERTRMPRKEQWSVERRMQEAREKNSTSDLTLGKTASKKIIEAGGWGDFSSDLYDVLSAQSMINKDLSDEEFVNKMNLDPGISSMMADEGMSSEDLIELRNDKGTQFMVNNVSENTSTASSWVDRIVEANTKNNIVIAKQPVTAEEEIAKKVILAGGKDNFTKISSNNSTISDSEKDVMQAFSMSIDLKNEGFEDFEAVAKVAEATGLSIENVAGIQTLALKKMSVHASDTYTIDMGNTKPKQPINKPKAIRKERTDKEIQNDAEDLGLLD